MMTRLAGLLLLLGTSAGLAAELGMSRRLVGHPDMPTFRFTREDARGFVLYLRSIQAP